MKSATQLQALLKNVVTSGLGPRPDYAEVQINAQGESFIRDNVLHISAEGANSCYWADYYGEYRGGHPWINPALEAFAKENGGYWEWVNPGCIAFCAN